MTQTTERNMTARDTLPQCNWGVVPSGRDRGAQHRNYLREAHHYAEGVTYFMLGVPSAHRGARPWSPLVVPSGRTRLLTTHQHDPNTNRRAGPDPGRATPTTEIRP